MKRLCPAARSIALELAVDIAERAYKRTRSQRWLYRMQVARAAALAGRRA